MAFLNTSGVFEVIPNGWRKENRTLRFGTKRRIVRDQKSLQTEERDVGKECSVTKNIKIIKICGREE